VQVTQANLWLLEANTTTATNALILDFQILGDANDGMALARRYTQLCHVGRTNTRSDHYGYEMNYWLGPTGVATTIATRDCLAYNPGNLTVVNLGTTGWEVVDGTNGLQMFDTQADAGNGVLVMRHATNICTIGRNEPATAPNHTPYSTTYFQ
jgi:hypothetical protein